MLHWINSNLDVVFFVYGLAFVVMGLSIAFQPRKGSEFKLGSIIWLLAGFGILHGLNEWLDMWAIIKGRDPLLNIVRWFCIAISYWFILEFGRRLLRIHPEGMQGWQRTVGRYFTWYLSPVTGLLILMATAASDDFWKTGSALIRYFFCFPGALLTGICFQSYYRYQVKEIKPLNVEQNFFALTISFIAYGLLGGLIAPRGDFFPSNVLNTELFQLKVGIPVQIFRAVIAISAAYHMVRILRIFSWERDRKLRKALDESISARDNLEGKVKERTDGLNSSNEQLRQEILDRKKAEQEAVQTKLRLEHLLESVPIVLHSCRIEGDKFVTNYINCKSINFMICESNEDSQGLRWWSERIHPEDREQVFSNFPQKLFEDNILVQEYRILAKEDTYRWIQDQKRLFRDSDGQPQEIVGSWVDITERKEHENTLAHMAYHDSLTGLPNESMLSDRFNQIIVRMKRQNMSAAILFIDLNRFKIINDTLGHSVGDEVLKEVASRLSRCIRTSDTLARIGGDEFIMLFPEINGIEDVSKLVGRVFAVLDHPLKLKEHEMTITASIGVSICPEDGDDLETLLQKADTAMYKAKEEKQNSHQLYSENMKVTSIERLKIEENLRRAFKNNEFLLHYQPQMDLWKGEIVGIEALIRWNDPKLGLIPPGKFIPLAEDTGLIIPLGIWIAASACKQNKVWQDVGLNPAVIAINVSRLQFKQKDFVDDISRIIDETGLDPGFLEIEITESIIMDDANATFKLLNKIRDIGIRIAIDDFGIGYSSLGYLKNMPIDILKIDQSFVNNMTDDENSRAICNAIISMANSLNIDVIAEGVETIEQLMLLRDMNCKNVQGYYISKPVPAEDIEHFLRKDWRFTANQVPAILK